MRPPFTYYGGKVGLAQRIVELMPPHDVYMETHFGSGAVLFAKPPSRHEIANDLDDSVVTFFRVLRERPEDLERVCRLTPYARAEFDTTRTGLVHDDELEHARRFWVRVNQSFAKTAGRQTGWSITTARTQNPADSVQGRIDRFYECAERLSHVMVEHCDAADLIERLATPETVIYADPPYVHSTRRSSKRSTAADYRLEMTDDDHHRLAAALRETPATVILSGYESPLYAEHFDDWWHLDIEVVAHSSNGRARARTGRVERLWMNREPAGTLFPIMHTLNRRQ